MGLVSLGAAAALILQALALLSIGLAPILERFTRARSPMRSRQASWTSEIAGGHLCVFGRPVRGSQTNCTTSGEYSVNTAATAKPKVSGSCASSFRQHLDKPVAAAMACLSVVFVPVAL